MPVVRCYKLIPKESCFLTSAPSVVFTLKNSSLHSESGLVLKFWPIEYKESESEKVLGLGLTRLKASALGFLLS